MPSQTASKDRAKEPVWPGGTLPCAGGTPVTRCVTVTPCYTPAFSRDAGKFPLRLDRRARVSARNGKARLARLLQLPFSHGATKPAPVLENLARPATLKAHPRKGARKRPEPETRDFTADARTARKVSVSRVTETVRTYRDFLFFPVRRERGFNGTVDRRNEKKPRMIVQPWMARLTPSFH